MIAITVLDEDLHFFDELVDTYSENITVSYDTGVDGISIVQVIIDVSNIMVSAVINVIGVLLTYKAQRKAEQQRQEDLELKEKETELKTQGKEEIEIRITNNGETNVIINSHDIETDKGTKDSVDAIVKRVLEELKNGCS